MKCKLTIVIYNTIRNTPTISNNHKVLSGTCAPSWILNYYSCGVNLLLLLTQTPQDYHKSNENIEVEKWPTAYHNRSDSCVLTHTRTHYKHWSRYKSKRTNLIIQGPNIQHLTRLQPTLYVDAQFKIMDHFFSLFI